MTSIDMMTPLHRPSLPTLDRNTAIDFFVSRYHFSELQRAFSLSITHYFSSPRCRHYLMILPNNMAYSKHQKKKKKKSLYIFHKSSLLSLHLTAALGEAHAYINCTHNELPNPPTLPPHPPTPYRPLKTKKKKKKNLHCPWRWHPPRSSRVSEHIYYYHNK